MAAPSICKAGATMSHITFSSKCVGYKKSITTDSATAEQLQAVT